MCKHMCGLFGKFSVAGVLFMLALLSGCGSTGNARGKAVALQGLHDENVRLYQIYIGSQGELLDPYTRETVKDEQTYLDEIFDNIARINGAQQAAGKPPVKLTIFIHGGLNSFESATKRVGDVRAAMLSDGNYPLFISWDSGFPGNYRDHLFLVRRGLHRPFAGIVSSPIVLVEDLTRSVVHIPVAFYNVFFGQRSLSPRYETSEERAAQRSLLTLKSAGEFQLLWSGRNFGHFTAEGVLRANPVKLVTAPFVDGLGKGAWTSMLRRTDLVLRKARDFQGASIEKQESEQEQANPASPTHVGSTAAAEFFRRWEAQAKSGPQLPAILIGHSMGTIIANNILAKYPRIRFDQIVYMGAAARLKDVETVVAPYLEANRQTRFYHLSLHPEREVNEAHYYDVIPRGSLLIWIDDTLADINSFQDRTSGSWFNMVRSANQVFMDVDVRRRVYLTRFGVRDGSPQNHGDFGRCPFWREEFWVFTAYQAADRTEELRCADVGSRDRNVQAPALSPSDSAGQ